MLDLEQELMKFGAIEDHLVSAESAIHMAKKRLGNLGPLYDELSKAEYALGQATEHVRSIRSTLRQEERALAERSSA